MKINTFIAVLGAVGLLAACAQQEETLTIKPQPTFDKFGNGSCEDGWIYVPGTAPIDPCIPEDECEPVYDSTGAIIECLPPQQGSQEDGGRPFTPRSPTGAPTAGIN
jgi:hypothetical protein